MIELAFITSFIVTFLALAVAELRRRRREVTAVPVAEVLTCGHKVKPSVRRLTRTPVGAVATAPCPTCRVVRRVVGVELAPVRRR